ncbi:hypothetical protein [Aeromonas salmonicida]|uniref:hypothetical protein n=1 Tax=Aeromonas salmonicida TaxID=645 RepID=UPI0012D9CF95|nr:hypothetical protein [Aeromonas salmonicida]
MIDKLEKISLKVRGALQDIIEESDYVDCELSNFPSGSCEVSSVILGLYLIELGIVNVVQTIGTRDVKGGMNRNNHVWLTVDGRYIVDITADQFDDCDTPVLAAERTDFHDTFKIYECRQVERSYLIRRGSIGYAGVYSKLLGKLNALSAN